MSNFLEEVEAEKGRKTKFGFLVRLVIIVFSAKKGYTFREVVDNALRALMELIKICTTYSRVW